MKKESKKLKPTSVLHASRSKKTIPIDQIDLKQHLVMYWEGDAPVTLRWVPSPSTPVGKIYYWAESNGRTISIHESIRDAIDSIDRFGMDTDRIVEVYVKNK